MKDILTGVIPAVNQEPLIDENGVKRDPITHRLLPGTASINPNGRSKITTRQKELKKYLSIRLGKSGERMVDPLINIVLYNPEDEEQEYKEQGKTWSGPRYTVNERIRVAEFLRPHIMPPKLPQETPIPKEDTLNVNYNQNVSYYLELIEKNKDRIKQFQIKEGNIIDVKAIE